MSTGHAALSPRPGRRWEPTSTRSTGSSSGSTAGCPRRAAAVRTCSSSTAPPRPTVARGARHPGPRRAAVRMTRAAVVVCHGGPATIIRGAPRGELPICVPRDRPGASTSTTTSSCSPAGWARPGSSASPRPRTTPRLRSRGVLHANGGEPPSGSEARGRSGVEGSARPFAEPRLRLTDPPRARSKVAARPRALHRRPGPQRLDAARAVRRPGRPVACVGEVVHLWERGLRDDELCGCGSRSASARSGSAWARARSAGGTRSTSTPCSRSRPRPAPPERPAARAAAALPRACPQGRRYAELPTRVYAAVLEVSGAEVVVDSTKTRRTVLAAARSRHGPARAAPRARLRGVVHAWMKQVPRPEIQGDGPYFEEFSPWHAGIRWMECNLAFDSAASAAQTDFLPGACPRSASQPPWMDAGDGRSR